MHPILAVMFGLICDLNLIICLKQKQTKRKKEKNLIKSFSGSYVFPLNSRNNLVVQHSSSSVYNVSCSVQSCRKIHPHQPSKAPKKTLYKKVYPKTIVDFHTFLVWLGCGSSLTSQHFACSISLSLGDQSNSALWGYWWSTNLNGSD